MRFRQFSEEHGVHTPLSPLGEDANQPLCNGPRRISATLMESVHIFLLHTVCPLTHALQKLIKLLIEGVQKELAAFLGGLVAPRWARSMFGPAYTMQTSSGSRCAASSATPRLLTC